jgi:hypothetical protein
MAKSHVTTYAGHDGSLVSASGGLDNSEPWREPSDYWRAAFAICLEQATQSSP